MKAGSNLSLSLSLLLNLPLSLAQWPSLTFFPAQGTGGSLPPLLVENCTKLKGQLSLTTWMDRQSRGHPTPHQRQLGPCALPAGLGHCSQDCADPGDNSHLQPGWRHILTVLHSSTLVECYWVRYEALEVRPSQLPPHTGLCRTGGEMKPGPSVVGLILTPL